jgi:hypothetical protein
MASILAVGILYLRIDGSGEIYINGAKDLFVSLHGIGRADDSDSAFLEKLRRFYGSPNFEVVSVKRSRHGTRAFFQVRGRFDDLTELSHNPGLASHRFRLERREELSLEADLKGGNEWSDIAGARSEGVAAFRFHFPSPVRYHNSPSGVERGNIVRWEQPISELLRGEGPLHLEARFDRRSVLSMTLMLLSAAAGSVILVLPLCADAVGPTTTGRRKPVKA